MKIRVLEPDEYKRLEVIKDEPIPNPECSRVIVAEDNGEIVGRLIICAPAHLEGAWIRPDHRGGTLLQEMELQAARVVREMGIRMVLFYAVDELMERYLQRMDYSKLPWSVWAKGV
jgi:hypothetical protein